MWQVLVMVGILSTFGTSPGSVEGMIYTVSPNPASAKRGWYPSPVKNAFRESFPGEWRFVRRFNRDDHGALPKELQRVESTLVIQQVGSRLAGNGPFISLHDSVYCRRSDLPVVESAFEQVTEAVGFRLALKVA